MDSGPPSDPRDSPTDILGHPGGASDTQDMLRSLVSSPPIRASYLRVHGQAFFAAGVLTATTLAYALLSNDVISLPAQISLALCSVTSWMAWWWKRKESHLRILVIAMSMLALGSIVPDVAARPGMDSIVAITLIVLWNGLLIHPALNGMMAVVAMAGLWVFGADFVPMSGPRSTLGTITYPLEVIFPLVAWAMGSGIHFRDRLLQSRLAVNIDLLNRERHDLAGRLERKAKELADSREQLMQAQKLKTVGTMASGLAHELNNILTPIRGLAELIAEGATPEQSSRYGRRILDSAVAAAQITGALLTYTRQGTFQPVRSNARQLLQSQILPVLSKSLPSTIHLRLDLERSVSIDVDRLLFQQCVTNLIFNAVDAMPNGGDIRIGLATTSRPCSESDAGTVDAADGIQRSAVITISDTGSGIQSDHLDRIFDPFFTTKAVGSGTGLGLAMVQGTVTRHGGKVLVESTQGKGTTFTLMLPLAPSEEKEAPVNWPVLRGEPVGPVVIVITEDQDTLDEIEELLETTDCAPICSNDAKAAMTLVTEMGDQIDLMILDWQLQEIDAARVFRTVREIFPEMPAIVVSDEPTDPSVQRVIGMGPTRSVRKPMDCQLFAALMTDLLHPETGNMREFTPVPIGTTAFSDSGPHPRGRGI